MHVSRRVVAALALAACGLGGAVVPGTAAADDPPGKSPPEKSEPGKTDDPAKDKEKGAGKGAGKGGEASKGGDAAPGAGGAGGGFQPPKPAGETRIERAKKLVRELEVSIAAARAAQPVDPALVRSLEVSLEIARSQTKPLTLDDLTPDERKAMTDAVKKELEAAAAAAERTPAADALLGWQEQALAKAFEGTELSEEEQLKARDVISKWFSETQTARMDNDSKKVSDLKRDRDERLTQALGKKKAQKVINNLNAMGGRR